MIATTTRWNDLLMKDFLAHTTGPSMAFAAFAVSCTDTEQVLRIIALMVGILGGIVSIYYHVREGKE